MGTHEPAQCPGVGTEEKGECPTQDRSSINTVVYKGKGEISSVILFLFILI